MQSSRSMRAYVPESPVPGTPTSYLLEAEPTEILQERALSLRKLMHILFKRKWLVLSVFVAGALGSVTIIVLLFSKPLYVATSQLLISPAREQVVEGPTGGAVPPWLGLNAVEQTAWTIEILKGRYLADRVVHAIGAAILYPPPPKPDLDLLRLIPPVWQQKLSLEDEHISQHEAAVATFLKNVDAKAAGRSSIVQVSFSHEDPELAARVVGLLSEMYLERHLGVQRNVETDAFFQEQFVALKKKLANSQEEIRAFKQLHSLTGSVDEEKNLAIQQLIRLGQERNDTRTEQPQVASRAAELRAHLDSTARSPETIEQLREKLTTLEIQENELAMRMTAEHPTLVSLRKEIRTLRQKLRELGPANLFGTSSRDSLRGNLEADVLRNEAEAKALRAREEAQTAKIAEYQRRLDALERVQPQFNRLQNQLQIDENNYRLYLTKFEESRIARAMDAEKISSVRVIEEARPPRSPIDSKSNSKIVLAILASAAGAASLALLLHFVDASVDTADDVERVLDLPVLASIPDMKPDLLSFGLVPLSGRRAGVPATTSAEA